MRPVAGKAGLTTAASQPNASTAATISWPGLPRSVESIFLNPTRGASPRTCGAMADSRWRASAGLTSRLSVENDTTSATGTLLVSGTTVERPEAANGAAASQAPVRSSAMRTHWVEVTDNFYANPDSGSDVEQT